MPTNTLAVKFPLEINDQTGNYVFYSLQELKEVIEQNIKMVLLTNPGERIFNNDFGVGLQRYLFMTENEITNGVAGDQRFPPLRQFIRDQIKKYISYITTEEIYISTAENTMNVKFRYYINNSSTATEFDLTISDIS